MTKDQLIELILDHYSNRKDAKTYFEFFLNPDTGKLLDKFRIAVDKELGKSKHGYSKAKVSVVKRLISDVESFQPGYEVVSDALFFTIQCLLYYHRYYHFSDSHYNLSQWIVDRFLGLANSQLTLDTAIARLDELVRSEAYGTLSFRNYLADCMQDFIQCNKF